MGPRSVARSQSAASAATSSIGCLANEVRSHYRVPPPPPPRAYRVCQVSISSHSILPSFQLGLIDFYSSYLGLEEYYLVLPGFLSFNSCFYRLVKLFFYLTELLIGFDWVLPSFLSFISLFIGSDSILPSFQLDLIGFYSSYLGLEKYYLVLPSFPSFISVFIGSDSILPSFQLDLIDFYSSYLGFEKNYLDLPNFIGLYWVLLGFISFLWSWIGFLQFFKYFYSVLLFFIEFYQALLSFIGVKVFFFWSYSILLRLIWCVCLYWDFYN